MKRFYFYLIGLFSSITLLSQNSLYYNSEPGTVDFVRHNNSLKVADGNSTIATSYTQTACGLSFTQASVFLAMRNSTAWPGAVAQPAPLVLSSLPFSGCGNVLKAFLYVSANGNGVPITATLTNPQNVTSSFSMSVIGQGVNTCWNYPASYSYRADVTSAITGNGTYLLSGIPVAPTSTLQPDDSHGATLFVIYKDNTQTFSGSIVMADGNAASLGGLKTSTISGFDVCGPVNLTTNFMILADLQKINSSAIALNSATPNYTLPTAAQTYYNFISDSGTPASTNQTSAIYSANGGGDCFTMVLAGMYFKTNCLTCTLTPNTPTLSIVSSSNVICTGNSATLTASGATTYTWNNNSTGASIVVSPTTTTQYLVYSTNANGCSSAVHTQSVVACTGLLDIHLSANIKLYPNPVNGKFNVEIGSDLENAELTLYNTIGQLVLKKEMRAGLNEIDVNKLATGYYYVVLKSKGIIVYQEKLIVE